MYYKVIPLINYRYTLAYRILADEFLLRDKAICLSVGSFGGRGAHVWGDEGHAPHHGRRGTQGELHRRRRVWLEHSRLLRGRGHVRGRWPPSCSEHARYGRGGVWQTKKSRLRHTGKLARKRNE